VILFEDDDLESKNMIKATPMQRPGKPEEIADAVHYFLTAPQFITGQVLAVDGGLSQR
jgi:3-oxoacyl-[acyl-carrier protein] reductase/pteridine reductase